MADRCSSGSCVLIEYEHDLVLVRDTKALDQEPIVMESSSWATLVLAPVLAGQLPDAIEMVRNGYVWSGLTRDGGHRQLFFHPEEWDTFVGNVKLNQSNRTLAK